MRIEKTRKLLSWAAGFEGSLLLVGAFFLTWETYISSGSNRAESLTLAAIAALIGVALILLARAWGQGRGWAATPLLVWQLLQISAAWSMFQDGLVSLPGPSWWLPGLLVFLAVAIISAVLWERVRRVDPD